MFQTLGKALEDETRLNVLKENVESVKEEFIALLRSKGFLGKEDFLQVEVIVLHGFSPSVRLRFAQSAGNLDERKLLDASIKEIGLKRRTVVKLGKRDISSVRELARYSEEELLKLRGVGKTTVTDINETLTGLGLFLGMRD